MYVLFIKEIRSFFSSAIGLIVIGIFLLLTGTFLWLLPGESNVLESGYATLDGLFVLAPWLYLFLIPALTMRFFAEEKKSGTIELLLTRPLSTLQIVLAKYFAGVTLVLCSLLPTLVYVYSVYQLGLPHGNIDMGGFFGSFIGLLFLASGYTAVGLFASSVTDNQIVSFLLAALLSFVLYYGFELLSLFFPSAIVQDTISQMGMSYHYDSMSRGVIDSRDVLYFITVSVVFLFVTNWFVSKRK
jgi:ABC-2 type transport system permease protein